MPYAQKFADSLYSKTNVHKFPALVSMSEISLL